MLDKIRWNSKIWEQVKLEIDMQGKNGQQACESIHDICKDLLKGEDLEDIIQRVQDHVYPLYICLL